MRGLCSALGAGVQRPRLRRFRSPDAGYHVTVGAAVDAGRRATEQGVLSRGPGPHYRTAARPALDSATAQLALEEAAEALEEFDEALSAYQAAARCSPSTTTWLRLGEMTDRNGARWTSRSRRSSKRAGRGAARPHAVATLGTVRCRSTRDDHGSGKSHRGGDHAGALRCIGFSRSGQDIWKRSRPGAGGARRRPLRGGAEPGAGRGEHGAGVGARADRSGWGRRVPGRVHSTTGRSRSRPMTPS